MTITKVTTLYNEDFVSWIAQTIDLLKSRNFDELDLDNLIDEVTYLAKKNERELESRLITLFEHALKRRYVNLPDCYRGWEITINNSQKELKRILKKSPSLKNYLMEIKDDCYQEALDNIRQEYNDTNLPQINPFTDDLLNNIANIAGDLDEQQSTENNSLS